jgi:membrane protein implicated in regulation of membrane protease activity
MNPVLLWIIAGSVLCFTEAVFPVAFVALMMGISAIAVALIALVIPSFGIQVTLWLFFSTLLIIVSRRFLPVRSTKLKQNDAIAGETLTAIEPGQTGRVLYEGNSWRAECEDQEITISASQKVYVVGRKGNTLIVYPILD